MTTVAGFQAGQEPVDPSLYGEWSRLELLEYERHSSPSSACSSRTRQ